MFSQIGFSSKAEALGDQDYHIKILEALKRMNIRLVRIETNKLRSLKAIQESLLNQIMALRTSIEQVQATGELNKSEMLASIQGLETKILDIESHLKNEVMLGFDKQNEEDKRLRTHLSSQINQLKDSLATDMVGFSKLNQQQFKAFGEANNTQFQEVVNVLEEQNKKLQQTQALLKTDLIPALDTQSEETRQALLSELSQARAVQKNFLEANHKQTLASLATVEEKNKALIEILKKSILVDEATKRLVETVQQNIGSTNQNIDQTKKMISILQQVLVQRMKSISETEAALEIRLDQDLAEVRNNQKTVTSQLETLAHLSNQINQQSTQIEQSIQQPMVSVANQSSQMVQNLSRVEQNLSKTIDAAANNAKAQADLSNEKLSRLVDILKSFAVEQGKIDQVLQALEADLGKVDQIIQAQKKLDVVLQSQKKVEKVIQGQKLGSIASQETIMNTQNKISEALKDLRRKANVNISRNDDILKKIKKQK
ncbi:uncharacterized protein METZ01_LOCUS92576 [marine metagenome]|uniref:Uncharacterized protein n=1 Tax=marine metagenome TaxID=408172 RepID=A0A381VHH1_9ZZZZ